MYFHSFFLTKISFLAFFSLTHKGEEVWPDVFPLFFSNKNIIFGFFKIQNGVWSYKHTSDIPLVTLIPNVGLWV